MSYTSIQTQIENAPNALTGLVPWVGTNGEKSILSNLNSAIRDKGFLVVEDVTALSAITNTDTHLVAVKGLGLYVWNSVAPSPLPTGGIAATGGGYWQILTTYGNEYRQSVNTDSVLTFTIEHGLSYDYPNVKCIDLATPKVPIIYEALVYIDVDSLEITFSGADASKNILIIVTV